MSDFSEPPRGFFPWIQGHARSILFLLAIFAIGGLAISFVLPVSLFPTVSFPRVVLTVDAGDRPAERMAVEVTYPLEEAVRAVPGVRGLRSTTSRGSAEIAIDFDWGQDMPLALLQAESEVNKVLPTLPAGTTFEIERRDPTVFPVIAYSLTSDTRSLVELHDIATYQLRPVLSALTGVAKVDVQGGAVEEYHVVADPAKLQSYSLTLSDISSALSAANVLTAVGRLQDHDKLYLVITDTHFQTLEQIGGTILRAGTNGIVRLDQVATILRGSEPQFTRVTADGHDAVLMQVFQQPGGNTVQIAKEVRAALDQQQARMPSGVKVANWYDQSDLILASASSVRDAVLIGVALAALVLLIFLRNWKTALIAILAVPAVLATTILLLYVLGMSFNIMTLGGMAAAVGLIVDDAIVMIEHIIRRLRGEGAEGGDPEPWKQTDAVKSADTGAEVEAGPDEWRRRVMRATREFSSPLIGSSASTIIIFMPLAFLGGVTGAFFKALSLTMAASLVISFIVAWLGVPVVAARLLGKKDAHQREGGAISDRVNRGYDWLMRRLLPRPWMVFLVLVPLLAGGYFAYENVGTGFMPTMDEGGFILDYVAPAGTSLPETDRLLRKVEAILAKTPEVQTYSRRTGLQLGGGLTEANTGDFFVRLKPLPRRPIDDVMTDVRKQIEHSVPGLDVEVFQLMEDLIGDLTSVPEPIEIKLFCDDEKTLLELAPKVADAIKVNGVVEIKSGVVIAGDALDIRVDRNQAALEGIDVDDVAKQLTDELSGNVATQVQQGPKVIGVRAWLPKDTRLTERDVSNFTLKAANGHVFPLKRVAGVTRVTGQPEINRENLKRMVAVTARIEGRDLGSAVADVKAALDKPGLMPAGVYYQLGGLYQQEQIAARGLTIVLIVAVLLVFALLLFLYERFKVALAMLIMPLLAMAGVFIGLVITGTELNITARMGMTMIVGIVTEVAIFYYSEFRDLPADLALHERMIRAGVNRMRPIAMTTFAAILALLPLALGIGQGSAMQQPLAIAIIAGLVVQLPLVLIVLPAFMVLFRSER
jgi:CzcA family heavy metal efflux pump